MHRRFAPLPSVLSSRETGNVALCGNIHKNSDFFLHKCATSYHRQQPKHLTLVNVGGSSGTLATVLPGALNVQHSNSQLKWNAIKFTFRKNVPQRNKNF